MWSAKRIGFLSAVLIALGSRLSIVQNTRNSHTVPAPVGNPTGSDSVAWIGAITGIISLILGCLSLLLHWLRGRPNLKIEIARCDYRIIDATNFTGLALSADVRISNTSSAATSLFRAEASTTSDNQTLTEQFPVGGASKKAFPYFARGLMILGHDTVHVPMIFQFNNLRFSGPQNFMFRFWHTHGRVDLTMACPEA